MTMTPAEQAEFLKGLGLSPDAPGLVDAPAKVKKAKKDGPKKDKQVSPDVDLRTMPASEVVFTAEMVEGYDLTNSADFATASRAIFDAYKSKTKDKDRNSLLHRRISEFLMRERRAARTGGMVHDRVQTSKEAGDLAQLLQQHNITAADLAALIAAKGQ